MSANVLAGSTDADRGLTKIGFRCGGHYGIGWLRGGSRWYQWYRAVLKCAIRLSRKFLAIICEPKRDWNTYVRNVCDKRLEIDNLKLTFNYFKIMVHSLERLRLRRPMYAFIDLLKTSYRSGISVSSLSLEWNREKKLAWNARCNWSQELNDSPTLFSKEACKCSRIWYELLHVSTTGAAIPTYVSFPVPYFSLLILVAPKTRRVLLCYFSSMDGFTNNSTNVRLNYLSVRIRVTYGAHSFNI